jgi:protocatechuate 3,4-dioxygenase beta subunit
MKRILSLGLSLLATFFLFGQSSNSKIDLAKEKLEAGKSISEILSDPQFDSVRTESEFRELIKTQADQKPVMVVMDREAGEKITVKGVIKSDQNTPLNNLLIYIYHTDTRGWYGSDRVHFQMNEGDRKHARLFAYMKPNAKGEFEFATIQPHGYPQSDLPAHIHFEVFDGEKMVLITELLFDDDDRLQGEIRERSEREKFYIAKPNTAGNKKIYKYEITITH